MLLSVNAKLMAGFESVAKANNEFVLRRSSCIFFEL